MPNSFASYAFATEEYAGPAVANSPYVQTNQGLFPYRIIEMAFGYGPNSASPVWINVTNDVTQFTTRRGRQHTLSRFEAGTVNVTLDNKSGKYSPFNGSGPYSGLIRPGMPVRIRSTWSAITYPVFYGFVESWPLTWPAANDSVVQVSAVDQTKFLNLKKAGAINAYPAAILADAPWGYWRLNDAPGSSAFADSSGNARNAGVAYYDPGGISMASVSTAHFQGDPLLTADLTASTFFGHQEFAASTSASLASALPTPISFEVWARLEVGDQSLLLTSQYASTRYLSLGYDGSNLYMDGPVQVIGPSLSTGVEYHIVGTMSADASPVMTLYVNGAQVAQATAGAWSGGTLLDVVIGGRDTLTGSNPKGWGDGFMQEAAVYKSVLSPTQVRNHWYAGSYPRQLEKSGQRVGYLASYTGMPAAMQKIDTGTVSVQGATDAWLRSSILKNMQDQEETENGALFIDAAGNLVYFDANHINLAPYSSVSLILGDSPLGSASAVDLPGISGTYVSTPDSAALSAGSNQLTANQTSVETDTSGFLVYGNATVARSTAQFRNGAASLAVTSVASGDVMVGTTNVNGQRIPVTGSHTYTSEIWGRAATVGRSGFARFTWYDSANAIIGSPTDGSSVADTTTGWVLRTVTATAPADAVTAMLAVYINGTGGAGEVHYIDDLVFVEGTGDHTVIAQVALDDWTPPAASNTLVSKWGGPDGTLSFFFFVNFPDGALRLGISGNGTGADATYTASSVATGFADGTAHFVAYSWRRSDGRLQFFWTDASLDAVKAGTATWTQLGTDRSLVKSAIFDSTTPVLIGAQNATGGSPLDGRISYVEIRNGLATLSGGLLTGGTVAARFDATKVSPTSTTLPTIYTAPTTGETWTVNGSGWAWTLSTPEEPYRLDGLAVPYDDQDVWNEVVVTPAGQAPQVAADGTSEGAYGIRTKSVGTLHYYAADAATLATTLLNAYKTPAPRVDSVKINPADDPTMLFGPVLGFDLLTRVEVRRRPLDGTGSVFDQTFYIEGIEHRVTKATWETTWRLSTIAT